MAKSGGEKGFPRVSTSLLEISGLSEAREEREVEEGEARGVSAGEILAEDAALLEVVEVGTRRRPSSEGKAVVDMVGGLWKVCKFWARFGCERSVSKVQLAISRHLGEESWYADSGGLRPKGTSKCLLRGEVWRSGE